ncbi:Type II secretion system protein E [BD1-7 clade bacterium]|uniref:Type II secretion system protein E n=1 Tax=BD1-7 clade bacterium TaxID=2029982 RepID=A0A5S9QBH9_9GAMM|nr:Type II secretion system protein E [BD1-7 clade bacterium]CAA0115700.1 Type II secretion system protein E [BD1-7 clade bacterium]
MSSAIAIPGLGRRLIADGLLTTEQTQEAVASAKRDKQAFSFYLASNGLVSSLEIAKSAADEFGSPFLDLDGFDPEAVEADLVSIDLVSKHFAIPLHKRGTRLYVGVADPTDLRALDEIKFSTGLNAEAIVVDALKLADRIKALLEQNESATGTGLEDLDDGDLDDLDIEAVDESGGGKDDDGGNEADETPVVRFINKVLLDAIRIGASDIHFEPYEKSYRVRFRTDGILDEIAKPPQKMSGRMAARLKVMSQMDISERRVPQDGRIKMKLSKTKSIDFRVNTLPTLWGEKIVLRILDPTSAQMGIDMLGYEPFQKDLYMEALHYPQGLILVTGPTGSGKTVSLYTGLNILNTAERNISTAEDPVEINLEGINQVNVNNKVGLTFSEALKSFLRQDPDIIMVGEIRDLETGSIAIKAAQTGHMVMSTLHTNSAAETITRLLNMGIPAFNLATSVSLIIAQRLGRRLCSGCKEPVEYPKQMLLDEGFTEEDLETAELMKAVGCPKCNKGYKGRVGIYEVVKITPALQETIMEGGNSIEISKVARREGFNDLRRSGLMKALQGVTSLEEVNRVTKD